MVEFAGHGTGKLSTDRLRALSIPKPPPDLQQEFASRVGTMRLAMSALRGSTDMLTRTRDVLLPKLVTGAIDVRHLDLDSVLEETAA
jgi:type I restriction enzyme S subunit